jgi:hypothetical protein
VDAIHEAGNDHDQDGGYDQAEKQVH